MKFKELVDRVDVFSVVDRLIELYPDQEKSRDAYIGVLNGLKTTDAVESKDDIKLLVVELEDSFGDDIEVYVNVSGYSETEQQSYAIEFSPWNEWLGMKMYTNSIKRFGEVDVMAHCLYEMTFCGFESVEVEKRMDDIADRVEEIKNADRSDFKTIDELWAELGYVPEKISEEERERRDRIYIEVAERNKNRIKEIIEG